MRAALYARVSTVDGDQNPETQLRILRDHAAARGWQVVGEYVDHASAADLRGRLAWRQVWNDDAPFWDILVVTKIDRGWRSVLAMLTDVERMDARGKSFQAATQPDLHTGGPIGRLVLSIMGAFAEFERELIRERTREGIARARAEGKPIGKRGADRKPRRKRGVALSTPLRRVN